MNRIITLAGPKGSGKSTVAQWLVDNRGYTEISLAKPLKDLARRLFPRVLTHEDCWGPSEVRERKLTPGEKREINKSLSAVVTYLRLDQEGRAILKELFGPLVETTGGEVKLPALYGPRDVAQMFAQAFEPFEESFHSPRTILQKLGTEWGRRVWDEVWLAAVRRTVEAEPTRRYVVPDVRFVNEAKYLRDHLGAAPFWVEAGGRIQGRAHDAHASEPTRDQLFPFCQGEVGNAGSLEELPTVLSVLFP